MKRLPVLAFVPVTLALFATACSMPGAPFSAAGAAISREAPPAILQNNEHRRWVTLTGVGKGAPSSANVVAGKDVVYVIAGWGRTHHYQGFATITMSGHVTHVPRQPRCSYAGSIAGSYRLYTYDIALNREGNSVFMNPDIGFPGSVQEFGWAFVAPNGKRSACYLTDVSAGDVSVLATGPDDTIWGAGAESPYLWRFAADGSATYFALPRGVTAFTSLVEGPDRAIWAQPANAPTVMRINPRTGRRLGTYAVPCALPAGTLAVASGLIWGYANDCVYSISPSGATAAYPVSGMIAKNSPHAIADGPDGDPWFVEAFSGSAAIGTLDPGTGKSKSIPLPDGASAGLALGTGRDQNLWVNDEDDSVYVYLTKRLKVSPSSLTLPHIRTVARLVVTEPGVTMWKAASANTAVARVKQSPTDPSVFLVTATGTGSTTVTVRDAAGNSVAIPVTVD